MGVKKTRSVKKVPVIEKPAKDDKEIIIPDKVNNNKDFKITENTEINDGEISKDINNSCPIDRDQIKVAVDTLMAVLEKKGTLKKEILFRTQKIHIQITTQRIPNKKMKSVLIPLPHPIYTTGSEICVFTKNIDKEDTEKSIDYFEDIFRNKVGFVPKIIPLRSLVKDHKAYYQKKMLCNSYDVFFGDKRIIRLLVSNTGKCFYEKNKQPLQIDFQRNLKKDFMSKLSSTRWQMKAHGNCSSVALGHTGLTCEQMVENIETCLRHVAKHMVRGWENVRQIVLTSAGEIALPLYKCKEVAEDIDSKDQEEVDYINAVKKRKHPDDDWLMAKRKRNKRGCRGKGWMKLLDAAEKEGVTVDSAV